MMLKTKLVNKKNVLHTTNRPKLKVQNKTSNQCLWHETVK